MSQQGRVLFSPMEEVVFGTPAAQAVSELVEQAGVDRVMIMASNTLDRETDLVDRIRQALGSRLVAQTGGVPAHSPRSAVMDATEAARASDAQLIVTIGGGSITDAAKAVRICLANGIETAEAMDQLRPGAMELRAATVKQIAVPSTLSAGEFSAFAGITNEVSKVKEVSRHPSMIPTAVVLDPEMTLATPEWLFLSTGLRAVDHSVEGMCSADANAYADAQAVRAIALLTSGLARVKADPSDLDARLDCQMGAWLSMGTIATGVPMGASHGIGYVLGAAFDVPHGYTSCVMLPAVLEWNRSATVDRQAAVASAMGSPGEHASELVGRLISDLGLPRTLGAVGIERDSYDYIATAAMDTRWMPFNPRPVSGPADIHEILELAS